MKYIEVDSYAELSEITAGIITEQVNADPKTVLGLATGSSPLGTYENLVKSYNDGKLDFSNVTSVNLDEYVGLSGEHSQSYRYFMNKNLFDKININKEE